MQLSTSIRKSLSVAVLSTLLVGVTSCSLGPEDLPSPRGGIGDGFDLSLEFASAMNLPAGANLTMDGLRVGEVRGVDVSEKFVTVRARVKPDTEIPTDSRAIIRQDTLLGDTYVALTRDPAVPVQGYLRPDSTVPLDRTTAPPQLEDTIAVLANFVNGGSIQRIQDTMGRVNNVIPALPEVNDLASVIAVDLRDLSRNKGEIDRTINGFNNTASALNERSQILSEMFSESAEHYWRRLAISVVSHIGQIVPSVGSVYEGGMWMVPMLNALADSGDVIRDIWDEGPATAEQLSSFLRSTLLPFAENPSVDVVSVESDNGRQIVGDAQSILRMLGAVR